PLGPGALIDARPAAAAPLDPPRDEGAPLGEPAGGSLLGVPLGAAPLGGVPVGDPPGERVPVGGAPLGPPLGGVPGVSVGAPVPAPDASAAAAPPVAAACDWPDAGRPWAGWAGRAAGVLAAPSGWAVTRR